MWQQGATQRFRRSKSLITAFIHRLAAEEDGATIVEYVLLAALIAVAAVGSITLLGENVSGKYDSLARSVPGA